MSKELDELHRLVKQDRKAEIARHKERYHYARSLGFSAELARRLQRSGKARIERLAQEL